MDIRSDRYKIVGLDNSAKECRDELARNNEIDAFIVIDRNNGGEQLVGLVTRRDLRFQVPEDKAIRELMTSKEKLVTIRHDLNKEQLLKDSLTFMQQYRVKRVLIVDDNFNFAGMVHEKDVIPRRYRAFAILPFKEPYLDVYSDHVKPLLADKHDIHVERADEIFQSGPIIVQIQKRIANADFIVADVSEQNPNVYYEVGYAHALKKDIIFITSDLSRVPFDIQHQRCIVYSYTPKGVVLLEEQLEKMLMEMLRNYEKGML